MLLFFFKDAIQVTTNEKNGKRIMEKSFGHHYTKIIPGYQGGKDLLNLTACIKKCIKMEKSSFAQRCSRNGGYFKCCVTWCYQMSSSS